MTPNILSFTVFFYCFYTCLAWDSSEMQMFDLVEEVKVDFYEYLGVEHTASNAAIKRAYRKLSVKMHPDKNIDDPESDKKFRQLVGIYEVLKDDEMRQKYDDVLVNGLPDWRMPVFYYRKLRRMSNVELGLLVAVLSTTIHYAALWGSRFEKAWTLEEQLSTAYKRHKARDRKRDAIDLAISNQLKQIPRPQWHDLLPFAICKTTYYLFMSIPILMGMLKTQILEQVQEKRQLKQELAEIQAEKEKLKLGKQDKKRRNLEQKRDEPLPYDPDTLIAFLSLADTPIVNTEPSKEDSSKSISWNEEDITDLVHAVARFPGGVPGRWERIAEQLNRSVTDVVTKSKELGERRLNNVYQRSQLSHEIPAFETSMNAVCGDSSDDDPDECHPTETDRSIALEAVSEELKEPSEQNITVDEPYLSRKKMKQQKSNSRKDNAVRDLDSADPDGWTQVEQKQLEVAIRSIGKDTLERWDRITECVPTKTKTEVMQRVKHLSTIIKTKGMRGPQPNAMSIT